MLIKYSPTDTFQLATVQITLIYLLSHKPVTFWQLLVSQLFLERQFQILRDRN